MSGELEAAGAATTAGLAAAVIEGRKGRKGGTRHGEGKCLNCDADLAGAYCSACGQPAHVHRTLGHVFEEFLHGVLHFDTKAWRTLPMLIGRPGTLTHKYIYGQRARFISPLAMFLFTVFLMFFAFAFVEPGQSPALKDMTRGELNDLLEDIDEAKEELTEELAEEREKSGANAGNAGAGIVAADAAKRKLARRRLAIEAEIARRDGKAPPAGAETLTPAEREGRLNVADEVRDSFTGPVRVQVGGEPRLERLSAKLTKALQNPDLLFYKILQNAYKFSFLLVPISLPFVALLFVWKRGLTLYDHVVFTLYSLSFVAVLFIAMTLAGALSWTHWASGWLFWAIPVHMFFQLKGAYALGWFSALWRTVFLLFFALFSFLIFVIIVFLIGALG